MPRIGTLAHEKLDSRRREVVEAIYGEGLTYQEAADRTGIPLGSVKRYLREGLSTLMQLLSTNLGRG